MGPSTSLNMTEFGFSQSSVGSSAMGSSQVDGTLVSWVELQLYLSSIL